MKCPSCGSNNGDAARSCNLCGKILKENVIRRSPDDSSESIGQDDKLAELRREYAVKNEEQERQSKKYDHYKMIGYGILGIMTFFILNLIVSLPGSLYPSRLLLNAIFSFIFGFPVGYLISRWGGGIAKGALISSGFFALLLVVTSAPLFFSGNVNWYLFIMWIGITLIKGLILGAIQGAIIGYQAKL